MACCNAFSPRTDLSPHSPTRTFNTTFFSLIAHLGFSDASRILRRIVPHFSDNQNQYFACCWHCSFFHGSWGPIPGCLSFVGPWVPGCFSVMGPWAHVCFFSPYCEFLVVIVHLVLLSRCSVRDFSSGLFQLHLVVACGWSPQHCCVVLCHGVVAGPPPVRWFTTTWSADFEENFLGYSAVVQHHCVILDPRVAPTSLAESVCVSLLHALRVSRAAT